MFSHKPDMPVLDLSYLTATEVAHIRQVLKESKESEGLGPENTRRYISSDDVIEAQRKSEHESFISSRDIVITALPCVQQPDDIDEIKEELTTAYNDIITDDSKDDRISSVESSPEKNVEVLSAVEISVIEPENSEKGDDSNIEEMVVVENGESENGDIKSFDGDDEEAIVRTDELVVVPGGKQKKSWWKKIKTPKRKPKKNKEFDSQNLEPIDETLVVYEKSSMSGNADTLERQSQPSETNEVGEPADEIPEDNTDVEALAAADVRSKPRVKLTMKDWVKARTWPKYKSGSAANTPSQATVEEGSDIPVEIPNMEKETIDSDQPANDSQIISETPVTISEDRVEDLVESVQPMNDGATESSQNEEDMNETKKQEQTDIVSETSVEKKEIVEEVEQMSIQSSSSELNSNNKNDEKFEENPESSVVYPVIAKLKTEDEILMEMEERDSLAPLHGNQSDYDFTDDEGLDDEGADAASMISRTTTLSENSVVGTISIAMIYYEPSARKNTMCPSKGTKLNKNDSLDIMTRRNYVDLTKARLPILRGSSSGAKPQGDGELHVLVREATGLKIPSAVIRNKSKTYVKCYLLPDKNHASKMHSMRIKETNDPEYGHIFVFRGFNKNEFQTRCVEILICGQTKRRGRGIRIGGIRLLANDQVLEHNARDNGEGMKMWNKVFAQPGEEVEAKLPLMATL